MQCHEVRKTIPDLIDGVLDFDDAFAVRQHINTCDQCYEEYRAYEQDEVAITQHVHRAPFAPVARDVIDEIENRGRAPWWDALLAGSYRLASVAGLVLVILVVAAGGFALREMANSNGDGDEPGQEQPAQDSTLGVASHEPEDDPSPEHVIDQNEIPRVVERLQAEGLVYDVAAGFGTQDLSNDGMSHGINYSRIAFDRHMTLLEYDIETSEAGEFAVEVVDADEPDVTLGTAQRSVESGESSGWLLLPAIDASSAQRTLTIRSEVNGELSEATPQVDVDLAALQELPEPREYSTSDRVNGVEMCCLTIERGAAISLLRWDYQVANQDAIVPVDENGGPNAPGPYPDVTVDGNPVEVLSHFFGLSDIAPGRKSAAVLGLPESGTLELSYDHQTVLTGEAGDSEEPRNVQGPWSLTADLGRQDTQPDPTPEPTIPPDVARDDPTPTAPETTPMPDDEADTPDTLRVLVYLVRDGEVAAAAREVDYTQDVATAAMEELLSGLTSDERDFALGTAVPEGTEMLDISLHDGTVAVNLSEEFGVASAGAESLQMRMAQVVHTLTQFETVDGVDILVEGQPMAPRGGEAGSLEELDYTRADFEDVAPAILLEHPGPGEIVTAGEVRLAGTSNTFEASLQIEIIGPSGEQVYLDSAMASSGTGTRGEFDVTVPADITEEGWGTIRMFEHSARDGSRTNVVEIPVRFEMGEAAEQGE